MKLKEFLITEGFFKNIIMMDEKEANELSISYAKNWDKDGKTWTMHDGEDHLFTYKVKTGELMTDKTKQEINKK